DPGAGEILQGKETSPAPQSPALPVWLLAAAEAGAARPRRSCDPLGMQDPADPKLRLPEAGVAELRAQVEAILGDRALLQKQQARAVREVVYRLDQGELRVAERSDGPERWVVHGWI